MLEGMIFARIMELSNAKQKTVLEEELVYNRKLY